MVSVCMTKTLCFVYVCENDLIYNVHSCDWLKGGLNKDWKGENTRVCMRHLLKHQPLNCRIMFWWFSTASCRIFSAGSIFQRHSVPTGLVWCLWVGQTDEQINNNNRYSLRTPLLNCLLVQLAANMKHESDWDRFRPLDWGSFNKNNSVKNIFH